MDHFKFVFILCLIITFLTVSGCSCFKQAAKGETAAPVAAETSVAPEARAEAAAPPPPAPPPPAPPEAAVAESTSLQDIHFDFDKYNIRPADAEILKKNAGWFKQNAGSRVKVEGNCDERGTVEYNMVLGQKRADAAKSYLFTLGVDGGRMDTVSYGKERPLDPGHNEEAWAKNRRDHFEPIGR
jgi:peptidoglycan-associated lipoprotein